MKDYTFHRALLNGIKPSHKRNKVLRAIVQQIIDGKPSNHSFMGETLPFILSELEKRGQPYVLLGMPGEGYVIKAAAKVGYEKADVDGSDQAVE
jgi:hypothetical protein